MSIARRDGADAAPAQNATCPIHPSFRSPHASSAPGPDTAPLAARRSPLDARAAIIYRPASVVPRADAPARRRRGRDGAIAVESRRHRRASRDIERCRAPARAIGRRRGGFERRRNVSVERDDGRVEGCAREDGVGTR